MLIRHQLGPVINEKSSPFASQRRARVVHETKAHRDDLVRGFETWRGEMLQIASGRFANGVHQNERFASAREESMGPSVIQARLGPSSECVERAVWWGRLVGCNCDIGT